MEHLHSVYDTDSHFSINPITRALRNEASSKTHLIQHDHNSERFTFEIPRFVEGHDMSLCNKIRVHYINIDSKTKEQKTGVYKVKDMQISPEGDDVVICSWLISRNATQLVGSLNFLIRFSCVTDGVVDYAWNTATYSGISVSDGINADETMEQDYLDVIEQWKASVVKGFEDDLERVADEMKADVTAWKETESANVIAATNEIIGQWNEVLDFERVRIDNLVAMRGYEGITENKEIFCNEYLQVFMGSNGVFCTVDVGRSDGLLFTPRAEANLGVAIPKEYLPLNDEFTQVECTDERFKVSVIYDYPDLDGYTFLIKNLTDETFTIQNLQFYYPLQAAYIHLDELTDMRVDHNGNSYDCAGDAVRAISARLDEQAGIVETVRGQANTAKQYAMDAQYVAQTAQNDAVTAQRKADDALAGVEVANGKAIELTAQMGNIETALDTIIAIQNELIGGDA